MNLHTRNTINIYETEMYVSLSGKADNLNIRMCLILIQNSLKKSFDFQTFDAFVRFLEIWMSKPKVLGSFQFYN